MRTYIPTFENFSSPTEGRGVTEKDLKSHNLNSLEDYYEFILLSYTNGRKIQARELADSLNSSQRKAMEEHLESLGASHVPALLRFLNDPMFTPEPPTPQFKATPEQVKRSVNTFLSSLRKVLKFGLPEVYKGDFNEYAYDLMAELPWSKLNDEEVASLLKKSDYLSLKEKVKEKFFYDLESDGGLML